MKLLHPPSTTFSIKNFHSSIKELYFVIYKAYCFFFRLNVNVLPCALNLMDILKTDSFAFMREEGIILN